MALQPARVDDGAERPEVGMVAHAVERHTHAIEGEALIRVELDGADAEVRARGIHGLAVLLHGGDSGVERRVLQVPELGVGHLQVEGGGADGAGLDAGGAGGAGGHGLAGDFAIGVERINVGLDGGVGGRGGFVNDIHLDVDRGGTGGDFRRGDKRAPVGDVHGAGRFEPHIAVDAAAGIPARGVVGVVNPDGDDVVRAGLEVLGSGPPGKSCSHRASRRGSGR